MNVSLNQTLLIYLLHARQAWKIPWTLVISLLKRLFFYNSKVFWNSYKWSCSFNEEGLKTCPWKTLRILYVFDWHSSFSVLYLFSWSITLLFFVCNLCCFIFYRQALSINPSVNVFVFHNFNVDHKEWSTYSDGTDRPGDLW